MMTEPVDASGWRSKIIFLISSPDQTEIPHINPNMPTFQTYTFSVLRVFFFSNGGNLGAEGKHWTWQLVFLSLPFSTPSVTHSCTGGFESELECVWELTNMCMLKGWRMEWIMNKGVNRKREAPQLCVPQLWSRRSRTVKTDGKSEL